MQAETLPNAAAQNKCAKCKKPAEQQCAKCLLNFYCSRECQISHWRHHKYACKTPTQTLADDIAKRNAFYQHLIQKVSGNIYIVAAHYGTSYESSAGAMRHPGQSPPNQIHQQLLYGVVHVQISEKLVDITKGGPNHFAHLNWVAAEDLSPRDYETSLDLFNRCSVTDGLDPSRVVQVMIDLLDHREHMVISLSDPDLTLAKIKASQKDPGRDLTILIDLK